MNRFQKLLTRKNDIKTLSTLMTRSLELAEADGVEYAGSQHLLLAALDLPDGSARRAFTQVGLDPEAFGPAIEEQRRAALPDLEVPPRPANVDRRPDRGLGSKMASGDATYVAAIEATHELHNEPGHEGPLMGAHIVAAVASIEHGTAARALQVMGANTQALFDAALAEARRDATS